MSKHIIAFFFFISLVFALDAQNICTLDLCDGWTFTETGKNEWKNAVVPGSVQNDLILSNVLPDPYFRDNEKCVQWVEDKNWDYRKTFTITDRQMAYEDIVLDFQGLDTYADVFLNGSMILHADNMFVGYKIPVKDILRMGENELFIRFYSPIQQMMPARATKGFEYPVLNDHRKEKLSVYSRKAPYHYGWDWGIRMVQMGIWRTVSLIFNNTARIDDFFVNQLSVTSQTATIDNQVEIFSVNKDPLKAILSIGYCIGQEESRNIEKEIILQHGVNRVSIPLEIQNPKRWMPLGWGEQTLYDFTAQIMVDEMIIAQKHQKIGLRDIKLVRENDGIGRSFYFKVNDIPIFIKGANYIPGEILVSRQDKNYYDRLFANVTDANMNMLRVWGGGIYENDYFYQLADEKGILIWQDFMFSCSPYPADVPFLKNVEKEIDYNVKRLRNYACIALWCGNNEIIEAIRYWGWSTGYKKEIYNDFTTSYEKLFWRLLPDKLKVLDPHRDYTHSSPDTANYNNIPSLRFGDTHYWGVWGAGQPFEILNERIPRFMSEFGFQAFPEMKTIRTFAIDGDMNINSQTIKTHQKSDIGNEAIRQYMDMYYHIPSNFDDFVYVSQVLQAEGMREGVEIHRRNRPYCMGTLYWQLNDDWPVVSWSSVDYFNNWKALHYKIRDVFAPIALGAEMKNNQLSFITMSEKLNDETDLMLHVQLLDFSGKNLKEMTQKIIAKANSSNVVQTFDMSGLLSEKQKHDCFVHAWLSNEKGKILSTRNFYFFWPNKLNLPDTHIDRKVVCADGKYLITLSSKKLAKNVFIEIPIQGAKFSDNFFDLMPGEKKIITITSPELKKDRKVHVRIRHLKETYQ